MQIAKIVPKIRTSGEGVFDYAIPPAILPEIKVGILVLVPFHGRKVEGIIVDIKRSSNIKTLKPLISLIDVNPVVDEVHIKLARWMSDYYLAPFSKCLFENIVPPAKRTIKKQGDTILDVKPKSPNQSAKKYLIVADFSTRLKFYLQAIKKTLARSQQVIILVPDLSIIPFFTRFIKNRISILHAGLTLTQRWQEWDKIRRGEASIVMGSNSALFAPVKNLGLVIIDQEENETYKSDQSPRFHVLETAEILCKLTSANLLAGSICPRVDTYFKAKKEKNLIEKKDSRKRNITIVDMNYERSIISETLVSSIEKTLNLSQKILLVFNRKGQGSSFLCKDCGWRQICAQCGLPVLPQENKASCINCEKEFPLVTVCPKCHGANLGASGLGTQKLKNILQEKFKNINIAVIEKDLNYQKDWQIAIVTSYALKKELPNIGLVAIIDADQNLNLPDFFNQEKLFAIFYKFLRIGKTGLLQTHLPENGLIRLLAKLDYDNFFAKEIVLREKYSLPPFGRLAKLIYKDLSEKNCLEETKKVAEKLKIFTPNITVLGPNPAFRIKKRHQFVFQIIVKYKNLTEEIKYSLATLPKGWTVEIDPISTL